MKAKYKIILISFVSIILLASVIVYAQTSSVSHEAAKTVTQEMINTSSEILKDLNSTEAILNTQVKYDELKKQNIYEISNSKYTINLDSSNNLIGIYSKSTTPVTTNNLADKNQAQTMIVNKYKELGLPADYELSYLEKFDNEIWQANFEKNYNGIYNKYESVKVFFIPENNEIVALTVFNEGHDNSEVSVSKEDAVLTASQNLNLPSSEVVSAYLSMEKSNTFYDENNSDTSVHTSWVIQTSDNSIVYVDASDNNVIGGDCINE